MQLISKTISFLLLIILCLPISVCGQEFGLNPGDTIYSYTAIINKELRFPGINIYSIDFPCVDRYDINLSNSPSEQIRMVSQSSLEEYYTIVSGNVLLSGYKGKDPFSNALDKEIIFLSPIHLYRNGRTLNMTMNGKSEFIILYAPDDFSLDIRNFFVREGISAIQLNGVMEWSIKSGETSEFYDFDSKIEGNLTESEFLYKVESLRIRKDSWYNATLREFPELSQVFSPKLFKYRSLYGENDLFPKVSIMDKPDQKLIYNSATPVKKISFCHNDRMDINVFPNPTYGDLKIQFNNAIVSNYEFGIYNIIGKRIWSTTFDVNNSQFILELDMPMLDKGIYLYSVINADGRRIISKRLIVIEP